MAPARREAKQVWVRDPALAQTDIFALGKIKSDDGQQVWFAEQKQQQQKGTASVLRGCGSNGRRSTELPWRHPLQVTVETANGIKAWKMTDVLPVRQHTLQSL